MAPNSDRRITADAFSSDDEIKDYALRERPIAVPRRFLLGHTFRGSRIESLAARFLYQKSDWSGELNEWEIKVLSRCFGLEVTRLRDYWYKATNPRRPFHREAALHAELLEDLWNYEHEVAMELYATRRGLHWLRSQKRSLATRNPVCDYVIEVWCAKQVDVRELLRVIVAQEYLLITSITWPITARATELLVTDYRRLPLPMWIDRMKLLCKIHEVPEWVINSRLLAAEYLKLEDRALACKLSGHSVTEPSAKS
jgi:hypothetical protein